jgi:chromate transport protein ChrA
MTALAWVSDIALVLHILSVIGILILLLMQIPKSPRRINPGVFHSGLAALVAGLVMVGVRMPLHNQDSVKWPLLNDGWVGLKLAILIVILILAYRNMKKSAVKNAIWSSMIALTVANILIALLWK